jgi:hypothetical protein
MRNLPTFARNVLSLPTLVLVLVSTGYGLYQRSFLDASGGGTFWDIVLGVLFSPQFIGWVALPGWLLYLIMDVKAFHRMDVLYRLGSRSGLWLASLRRDANRYAAAAFSVVVVLYVVAIGRPLEGPETVLGIRSVLLEIGITMPVVALVLQAAFLGFSFLVIATVIRTSFLVSGRLLLPIGIALGLFLWALLSAGGAIPAPLPASASRFLGVIATLRNPSNGALVAAVWATCVAVAGLLAREMDRRARGAGANWSNPWIYLIAVVTLIVGIRSFQLGAQGASLESVVMEIFRGNLGTLMQSLTSVLIYVGFAWAMQTEVNRAGRAWRDLELIRLGSLRDWFKRAVVRTFLCAMGYLVAIALAALLPYASAGRGDYNLSPQAWFQFVVTGLLELVFYAVVTVASSVFVGSRLAGTAALALLVALSVVPLVAIWYPFGATSFARVELGGWGGVLTAAGSSGVAALSVILVCWALPSTSRPLKWRFT